MGASDRDQCLVANAPRPPTRSALFPYTPLFRSRGVVGTGARRGRAIGFPTANLVEPATLVPGDGVYAVAGHERSEEHTSELQSHVNLVCRLLLEIKNSTQIGRKPSVWKCEVVPA